MKPLPVGNGILSARVPPIFAALIEALQLQGANADALRSLGDEQWRQLLRYCDSARLTLSLAQKDHSGFPGWVRERLNRNLSDTARHFECVKAAYQEAAAELNGAGIPYVVLKGFTQAPDFVPEAEFRRQGDIDLYTPRENVAAAMHTLQGIGYAPCGLADYRLADHAPTLLRFGNWKWSGNLYDPSMPPAIEVHFCLWNETTSLIPIPDVEEFWARRISRSLGRMTFPALEPVDHAAYFALHVIRGVFRGEPIIHHALELATFLDGSVGCDAFWSRWTTMHSSRSRSIQAIAFALASACFSSRVCEPVKEEMARLPLQHRAWIDTCGGIAVDSEFHRTRDGRLLQFLLAESFVARRKITWAALGPGVIAGPRAVAAFNSHPTTPPKQNALFVYVSYLVNRVCAHGYAILRVLANARILFVSNNGLRRV